MLKFLSLVPCQHLEKLQLQNLQDILASSSRLALQVYIFMSTVVSRYYDVW